MIRHRSLTTDNRIYVSNVVANVFVTYGMCIVPYPRAWLEEIQGIILATIKMSMHVPKNTSDEPFFMPVVEGGHGLVHLLDLQTAITCSGTLWELMTLVLSACTTAASWHLAYAIKGSHMERWAKALKGQGWQAWPKVRDLDWLGNLTHNLGLAHSLVQRGICRWSQITVGGQVKPRMAIVDLEGRPVSPHKYEHIKLAFTHAPLAGTAISSTEAKLWELSRFSPLAGELQDLHYHYPSNTLTVFTDGSCKGDSVTAGVFFAEGSWRNCAFQVGAEPISMVAELHTIEEVLLCSPAGVNMCMATDSKSSIEAICGWRTRPPGRRASSPGAGVIERIVHHLDTFAALGRSVRFQHVYSHISNKQRSAAREGPNTVAALTHKLDCLHDQLWGPMEAWTGGNEGADKLADRGHSALMITAPWVVPAGSPSAVLFDQNGWVVEGDIHRKVLHKWTECMHQKPVLGAALREANVDHRATHVALGWSPLPSVW